VPALALTDVLVRDPDPVVPVGVGDHLLDQHAVRLLDVRATGDLGLRLAHPDNQGVANALEIGRVEHARPAGAADGPIDPAAREGGYPELPELSLEPGDLATKLLAYPALLVGRRGGDELELVLCK
jgi:hypothetical protein